MADETPAAAAKASTTPTIVEIPRTVHELTTGSKGQKIDPETFLTDDLAKEHKLDSKAIAALVATGAVELVEVHKA